MTADNRMTTHSHIKIDTGDTELDCVFKLSDWIVFCKITFILRDRSSILTVMLVLEKLKLK